MNLKKKKLEENLNRPFSKKRHTDSQQTHEKMFSVTNHQGNANQNQNAYHLTPFRIAIIEKTINNKSW